MLLLLLLYHVIVLCEKHSDIVFKLREFLFQNQITTFKIIHTFIK